MPNLKDALTEEIQRLARKEIKQQVSEATKTVAMHKKEIAQLKKEVASLTKKLDRVSSGGGGRSTQAAASDEPKTRFSPAWLAKHREKLELSAADYGRLVGVSALSIYKWEKGETNPRAKQREALAAVRGLGKREAVRQLEKIDAE